MPSSPGRPARTASTGLVVVALAALLAACGSGDGEAGGSAGRLRVQASFYPLQWMAEGVGGNLVEVSNLTDAGTEPHDLELSPDDVAALADADVVAYLAGFQPAVDDAVAGSDATAFDAAEATDLGLTYTPIEEGEQHDDEAGATDPHFWLDPVRFAEVTEAFAAALAEEDPDNASTYERNAAEVVESLEALDAELEAGLADCARRDLVTSHNAFGYLADRYGFEQVGITGITPEAEPSAGQLAEVSDFVRANDVRTIYFETLVSPDVAETVASEAGARTAVLDPIEGLGDDSEGDDYLEIMRANLASLREGQPCP
ncbi:MAG TPA: zinc ABC transporter substrate-binding protein [Aquihabitans sp.]|jgi:zinc transport system substrate-binding protein|nr:zinc ABC transporter substrate-binding protein [Aquihabitans sp.]